MGFFTEETIMKYGKWILAFLFAAPLASAVTYQYAAVESATVARSPSGYVAVLTGVYTNSCLRMRDVPVTVRGDTVQLYPIMEMRRFDSEGYRCSPLDLPFRLTQRLPDLPSGRYSLRVRNVDGRSVDTDFLVE
jgi:hypothetical protein